VHITEEHNELAGRRQEVLERITDPAQIFSRNYGELLAVREIESGKYLVVVYRELQHDDFVITAFLTRSIQSIRRRQVLWLN
jgi:hypothetical protein